MTAVLPLTTGWNAMCHTQEDERNRAERRPRQAECCRPSQHSACGKRNGGGTQQLLRWRTNHRSQDKLEPSMFSTKDAVWDIFKLNWCCVRKRVQAPVCPVCRRLPFLAGASIAPTLEARVFVILNSRTAAVNNAKKSAARSWLHRSGGAVTPS